jgi:hypothetical protein
MADEIKTTILPPHIEAAVAAIAQLHAKHNKGAKPFQRVTEDLTAYAGRPLFIAWLSLGVKAR